MSKLFDGERIFERKYIGSNVIFSWINLKVLLFLKLPVTWLILKIYMASESFPDEIISHFIKKIGPGSAFSCILDVQFPKIFPGIRREVPRLAPRRK